MENNRELVLKELEESIAELKAVREVITDIEKEINTAKAEGAKAIQKLKTELEAVQKDKAFTTDVSIAKNLGKKAQELQEDISLQEGVITAVFNKNKAELEERIEELYSAHSRAEGKFHTLFREYKETTCLRSVADDSTLLSGFMYQINDAFRFAKQALIRQGIITQADIMYTISNKRIHLGRSGLYLDLRDAVFSNNR